MIILIGSGRFHYLIYFMKLFILLLAVVFCASAMFDASMYRTTRDPNAIKDFVPVVKNPLTLIPET